ncbi:DUF3987 domain-containing protein [Spirosoma fluminis]
MSHKVSVYATVSPSSYKDDYTVEEVLKVVRSPKFKTPTEHLRSLVDPEEARIFKAGQQDEQGRLIKAGHFYGVTWTGRFEGGKTAAHLKEYSRLICMDIDGLTADQVSALIEQLRADEYTHALFVSPSGTGVKWVVKNDVQNLDEHKALFYQLSEYLHDNYQLTRKQDVAKGAKPQIDPSGKNVDRLCFLPYDPDAYHNPTSSVMPLVEDYLSQQKLHAAPTEPTERYAATEPVEDKTRRLLNDCISALQAKRIDLTDTYEAWVEIGFAFASMGDEGRIYFHEVSRLNAGYNYQQCDAKFSELLRNRNGSVSIGTFFRRCEEAMGRTWERSNTITNNASLQRAAVDWPQPKPLHTPLLPVLPVTPDMLPDSLRPWLMDIAHRMKCPPDFVAATCVVMLSALIGTRLAIKPKQRDDWTIIGNLWGGAIGDPSTMKTPSVAEVFKPLYRLMAESREQYEEQLIAYEAERIGYETQKKVYQTQEQDRLKGKAVLSPVEFPTPPQKPTERRFIVNDSTIEKLAELLNENLAGLLVWRDELTGLLAGWDRSGREEDRAFYLEAWNGNGSKTVDRIGRGTTHVSNLCVSLFGGIQPAKLLGYLQAATGYDNDGFVQRLQLAVYPNKPHWQYIDEHPDSYARDTAFNIIKQLVETDISLIGYEADPYNRYPYTRFSEEAQSTFRQWLTEWETQVLPAENGLLLEHFTKYRSLMPSLALVFHVVNCIAQSDSPIPSKQPVSLEAAQMAVRWCAYLQSHARRIYGLLDTINVTAARELLRHLKAGDLKDGFKVRDVAKKGWSNLTTADKVEYALAELVASGWVREVQPPAPATGRPEAPYYLIHPKIFQNE